MKNGSDLTESHDYVVAKIKEKYSSGYFECETEEVVQDIYSLLRTLENRKAESRDPRVTIELAKIRKENGLLKKELAKFFSSKDSIEKSSQKLEHLFQVDNLSLLRYENSDLKEKNDSLVREITKLQQQVKELTENLESETANLEKLKSNTSTLRIENSNLIMTNREITKRNKILEDQSKIVETLQKKLRATLTDTEKGKSFKDSVDCSMQTEDEPVKSSKMLARLSGKKSPVLRIDIQSSIHCKALKKFHMGVYNVDTILLKPNKKQSPLQGLKKKLFHNIESFEGIMIKPQSLSQKLSQAKPPKAQPIKKNRLQIEKQEQPDQIIIITRPKPNRKRLRIRTQSALSIIPKINPAPKLDTSSKALSPPKPKLSISKPISSSIIVNRKERNFSLINSSPTYIAPIPHKKPKLRVSKPSSSSILPLKRSSKSPNRKRLRTSTEISILIPSIPIKKPTKPSLKPSKTANQSIVPLKSKLSLFTKKVYNRCESEEFEVFNAANVYKPSLSFAEQASIKISVIPVVLSIENLNSLYCKKKVQRLKLSVNKIFAKNSDKIVMQCFKSVSQLRKLEIVVYRRYAYVPEGKIEDEDAKSTSSGNARRKARTPVRKPAIEEYFNLTFQAVKMNFPDRDKISGLNCDDLQQKALQSGIQFNMYHEWVKEQFGAFAMSAAKRPSIMVKGK